MQHGVDEICQITDKTTWKFCPGSDNPADLSSQSVDAIHLINNTLWWNGPAFLLNSPDSWPDLPTVEAGKELIKSTPTVIHSLNILSRAARTSLDLDQKFRILDHGANGKLL